MSAAVQSCKVATGIEVSAAHCMALSKALVLQTEQPSASSANCSKESGVVATDLPTEEEFFAAISDCRDVVILAKGGQTSVHSGALQRYSEPFRQRFSAFLQGTPDSAIHSQAGKAVLDLDCSLETAEAVVAFVSSKGRLAPKESSSPATLRQLAAVSHEWGIQDLLDRIDVLLAQHVRADTRVWSNTDRKSWQYSGSHIRQRSVQTFELAAEVGLTQTQMLTEIFLAANWGILGDDKRLAKSMYAEAVERICNLADAMQRKMRQTATREPSHFRSGARGKRRRGKI